MKANLMGDTKAMGLYNVKLNELTGKKNTTPLKNNILPSGTTTVYISGAVPNFNDAVTGSQKQYKDQRNLALFYCPSHIVNELGIWKSSIQTRRSQAAVTKLAEVIKTNQKTKSTWAAEAEGAALLADSVKSVSGTLENFTFQLHNPVGDSSTLLASLKQKKAKFLPHAATIDQNHRPSYISMLVHQPKLLKTVENLKGKNAATDGRLDNMLDIKDLGNRFSTGMTQKPGKTFLDIARQANKLISKR